MIVYLQWTKSSLYEGGFMMGLIYVILCVPVGALTEYILVRRVPMIRMGLCSMAEIPLVVT